MRARNGRYRESIPTKIKNKMTAVRRANLLRAVSEGDVAAVTKYVTKYGADSHEINFWDGDYDHPASRPLMAVCELLANPHFEKDPEPYLQILRVLLTASAIFLTPHHDHQPSALDVLGRQVTPLSQQAFAILWQRCSTFDKNRLRGYGAPLMVAAQTNNIANVDLIMADPDVIVPGRIPKGEEFYSSDASSCAMEALFIAASNYHPEIFCKMYASWGLELDLERCRAGMSYFLFTLLNNERIPRRLQIAEKIIRTHHFDINTKDEQGRTLLILAIQKKQAKIIQALLSNSDIDVNVTDAAGVTPLLHAFNNGDTATTEMLIARNDIRDLRTVDKNGLSALTMPDDKVSHTYVEKLMAKADLDINTPIDGLTPLLYLIKHGCSRVAEKLAARKDLKNINAVDELGQAALAATIIARYSGDYNMRIAAEKIFPLLLAHPEIDVSQPDKSGMTPLLHSIRKYTMYDTHPFTLPLLKREDLREINARDPFGRTALYMAIFNFAIRSKDSRNRDYDLDSILSALLAKQGIDINLADNAGVTPLLLATTINEYLIALKLLARPEITNLNARDARGRTAFYVAIESGFMSLAGELLKRKEVDVSAANVHGFTPLLVAVKNGLFGFALKILARDDVQSFNAVDDTGKSALLYAAAKNNQDIVDAMLAKEGVDINLADKSGCTPLIAAISKGNTAIALKLIERMDAASLNAKDENGVSALFAAVTTENDGLIDVLLAKDGIDINTCTNEQNTPFLEALRLGNVGIANKFLAREEVNVTVVNKYSLNALLWAVHKGPEMLDILKKLLLRQDVDIDILNQRTKEGWSALMLALRASYAEAVELLLATQKVNTNIVSEDDKTALKIAAAKNDIKTLNLLLDHGADVNQADAKGDTLLIHGVKSDNRAIVRVALDRGASVAHKNASGDNALLLAVKNGNTLMLGYLLERLAAAPQPEVDVNEIFLAAVKLDDAASLRKLLDHARQPQGLNKDINEAFIEAVTRNNEAMIDIIYQYGVDLNYACDKTGRTALETALDLKLKVISSKLLKFESDAKLRLDAKPVNEVAADVPNNAEPARQPSLLSKHFLLRVKEVLPGTGVPELSTSASETGMVVDGDVTIDYSKAFC